MIIDDLYKENKIDELNKITDATLTYEVKDNYVYLTLTKFKMINYYNKVLTQLDGRKGILYLDSGNHFQIRE